MLRYGTTRTVWLVGRYAFKVPALTEWRLFLLGLLANMQERRFSSMRHPKLCPVHWSIPGGWLLVMKRADPLTREEYEDFCSIMDDWIDDGEFVVPVEAKLDSFGRVDGRIVAVDYGN